jgi:hypothetical protein
MAVVSWPVVGGYHGGAVPRRTAALLTIGSTTPATAGHVKGAQQTHEITVMSMRVKRGKKR